jgi:hypothetical protein
MVLFKMVKGCLQTKVLITFWKFSESYCYVSSISENLISESVYIITHYQKEFFACSQTR